MAVVQMPFVTGSCLWDDAVSAPYEPGPFSKRLPSGCLPFSSTCSAAFINAWSIPVPDPAATEQGPAQPQPGRAQEQPQDVCTTRDLVRHLVRVPDEAALSLSVENPVERTYLEAYGNELVEPGQGSTSYFTMSAAGAAGLQAATEQLHQMFLAATERVMHDDRMLRDEFRIPEHLWPRVRASWSRHRDDVVSGRFDFALTDQGVKVYEYNADSASCLVECGFMCDKWATSAGIGHVGRDSGSQLFQQLVQTWRARKVDGVLHMLHDADPEERIHSLYMKSAAEKAGIRCKVYESVASFSWTASGDVQDADGELVRNVWKTWNWQTVLNQLKEAELAAAAAASASEGRPAPGLADILLSERVRVFEPLWTLLPACKAILPVLWDLYPGHPLLLNSAFQLTPELLQSGYASKPITGRGGYNVMLYGTGGQLIEEAPGKWEQDDVMYQELCHMPSYDGKNVQVCCFAVNGKYGGTVLRWGETQIIRFENSLPALRVLSE